MPVVSCTEIAVGAFLNRTSTCRDLVTCVVLSLMSNSRYHASSMPTTTRYQFSIKSLLATIFIVAVVVATFPSIGHYYVFAVITLAVIFGAWRVFGKQTMRAKRIAWVAFLLLSMCAFFVSTVGPASWFLARYNTPDHRRPRTCALYHRIYQPIATSIVYAPPLMRQAGMWYVGQGMPEGTYFHSDWPNGMGWTTMSSSDPSVGMTFTVVSR